MVGRVARTVIASGWNGMNWPSRSILPSRKEWMTRARASGSESGSSPRVSHPRMPSLVSEMDGTGPG